MPQDIRNEEANGECQRRAGVEGEEVLRGAGGSLMRASKAKKLAWLGQLERQRPHTL